MNPNTGEIVELDDEQSGLRQKLFNEMSTAQDQIAFARKLNKFTDGATIPLTEKQVKVLTPMNAHQRKGWMRNQPCCCGSGVKFKKCHWGVLAGDE